MRVKDRLSGGMLVIALSAGTAWAQLPMQQAEPAAEEALSASLEPAAVPVPSALQLEAWQARIGAIDIQVDDIFDTSNPKESGAAYRLGNTLHINTRASTIRPQLLFRTGDVYSMHVMAETARNLRDRRYLEDASVIPVRYDPATNTVDVLVKVHDVWTLNPGTTFGRSGGQNRSGFQLEEANLLGLGKSVQAERIDDVDRSTWKFGYRDPNFLSTRWDMSAGYNISSDGGAKSLSFNHPFYALNTRWSAGLSAQQETRTDYRFEQGDVVDQWHTRFNFVNAQAGWSTGLRGKDSSQSGWRSPWVLRSTLGYRLDERSYAPDAQLGTTTLPANLYLRYPWLNLTWFEDRYVVTRNRDRIERTEDLFVGRSVSLTLGYLSPSLGSSIKAWKLEFRVQDAYQLGEAQELIVQAGINGRREAGEWRNAIFQSGVRYDWRQSARWRAVLKYDYAHSENLDDSQQLYLGSDEGLRGYPLRYRSGTQRSVLTLEQRFYTKAQILRLLSVGGAAFVDMGQIGGQPGATANTQRLFTDVGVGMRLGNIRSSRGDVFHVDVAYPVDAPKADRTVQFSVTTKTSF